MTDETSRELSPYALMSVLDGELVKTVLLNLAALERKRPLCVLELGCGLSTLSYTKILAGVGAPFRWTALEYDPSFLNAKVAPQLSDRPDTIIRMVDDGPGINNAGEGTARLEIVCWNRGRLQPFFGGFVKPGVRREKRFAVRVFIKLLEQPGKFFRRFFAPARVRRGIGEREFRR